MMPGIILIILSVEKKPNGRGRLFWRWVVALSAKHVGYPGSNRWIRSWTSPEWITRRYRKLQEAGRVGDFTSRYVQQSTTTTHVFDQFDL